MKNSSLFWTIVAVIVVLSLLIAFPITMGLLVGLVTAILLVFSVLLDLEKYGETNLDKYEIPFQFNIIYRLTKFNNWLNSLNKF